MLRDGSQPQYPPDVLVLSYQAAVWKKQISERNVYRYIERILVMEILKSSLCYASPARTFAETGGPGTALD